MSFIRKIKKSGKVYLAEVENRRVGGKVVQRFIRYVGKEADGRTVLSASMSDVEVEEVKLYGPLLVLHHCVAPVSLRSGKNRPPAGFRRFDVAARGTPASQPQPTAAMACS